MKNKKNFSLEEKLDVIEVVVLDVDGTLTDGRVWITSEGDEMVGFSVRDGMGIVKLIEAGIEVAILSGRDSNAAALRAKKLGIKRVMQGRTDKVDALNELLDECGAAIENVAYVGDDIADLGPVKAVGLGVAVADAIPEMIEAADLVLDFPGGRGAVRQLAEMILKRRNLWP